MTKLPSMPFFPADFFADSERVSHDAAKAYLFLLGHAWLQGGKLPNDDKILARLSRCSHQLWRSVKIEVLSFWELGQDGYFRNSRLTKELEWVSHRIAKNSIAGRLGGIEKAAGRARRGEVNRFTSNFGGGAKSNNSLNSHNTSLANANFALERKASTHTHTHKEESFNELGQKKGNGGTTNTETGTVGVYVKQDTRAGEAWNEHSKRTNGKSQVWDAKGGWWFETEWPPEAPNPLPN